MNEHLKNNQPLLNKEKTSGPLLEFLAHHGYMTVDKKRGMILSYSRLSQFETMNSIYEKMRLNPKVLKLAPTLLVELQIALERNNKEPLGRWAPNESSDEFNKFFDRYVYCLTEFFETQLKKAKGKSDGQRTL